MPTGDIMRATLEGKANGEPLMIDLGFVSGSGEPDFESDAIGLANAIYTALDLSTSPGSFMLPLSVGYSLDTLRVSDLSPGVAASRVSTIGIVGGNDTDDALPSALALCVTWRTALKGPANRGRSYLGGFAEDSQTGGYWIPEIQAWAAAAFANPLMEAFGPTSAAGYALSVVHTVSGGARLIPPTATPIVGYSIHNETRTLRRRGVGVRISRHRTAP